MAGVVHIQWYATVFRGDALADGVVDMAAPVAMRYGATRYTVQRSQDDAYRILQAIWFDSHDDWYRYWEGPEMIEFRARYATKYQIPIVIRLARRDRRRRGACPARQAARLGRLNA